MPEAVRAYVGIGANLGDPARAVREAIEAIGRLDGVKLVARSSLYATKPIDAGGPDYVNAVAEVETALGARQLLAALQILEQQAGRERPYRNAPRTLDLDLLLYGSERIEEPDLVVPHPRMDTRAFVLVPLAEIAPGRVTREQLDAVARQGIAPLPPA